MADDPLRASKFRTYAVLRMASARGTGRTFIPAGAFNLSDVLGDCLGIHTGGEVEDVEALFHPSVSRFAREQFWHKSEKFSTAPDGRLRLTMRVANNPELEALFLRYGPRVEIVRPRKLRETFERYAREFHALYHRRSEAR